MVFATFCGPAEECPSFFCLLIGLLWRLSEVFESKLSFTFYFHDLSVLSCVNAAGILLRL